MRLPVIALTVAAIAWAVSLPLAAAWPSAFASAVHAVGHLVCHQRPERSFAWSGRAWPVCARCTGIYFGAAAGLVIAPWLSRDLARVPRLVRRWLALASMPIVASLLFEWTSGIVPFNSLRAATGAVAGLAAGALLGAFLREPLVRPEPHGHEVN